MKRKILSILILLPILGLMACGSVNQENAAVTVTTEVVNLAPEEPIPEEETAAEDTAAEAVTADAAEETLSADEAALADIASGDASMEASDDSAEAAETEDSDSADESDAESEDVGNTVTTSGSGHLVVLDPGHSAVMPEGSEPNGPGSSEMKAADAIGTHGDASGLMEYELTLTICQKLRTELQSRGYQVLMTREDSQHACSCSQRAKVANENNADVFLRVHADGSTDTSANGAMTICITSSNPFTPATYSKSSLLSQDLIDTYCSVTGRKNRGVWYTDTMTGNNWATVPTTLIEMGFMTNANEDLWMASAEGQTQIIKGIADGLDKYFANVN